MQAGVLYGSGKTAGQGVSLTAVALAKKVAATMFVKKLTTGVVVMAAVAGALLLGGGLTVWFRANAATLPAAVQKAAKDKAAPDKEAAATAVTVSRPVRREVTPFEDFIGRLEVAEWIPIMARVSGNAASEIGPSTPTRSPGKIGFPVTAVKKGEVLFQIDPAPFKEALAKAEAKRDAAIAGPERDAAEAAVHRARQNLDATRIVAPADGEVQTIPSNHVLMSIGTWEKPRLLVSMYSVSFAKGVCFDMDERTYLRYRRAVVGAR